MACTLASLEAFALHSSKRKLMGTHRGCPSSCSVYLPHLLAFAFKHGQAYVPSQASATVWFRSRPSFYTTICHQYRMQTAMPNVNAICMPTFGKYLPRSLIWDLIVYHLIGDFYALFGAEILWFSGVRLHFCEQKLTMNHFAFIEKML